MTRRDYESLAKALRNARPGPNHVTMQPTNRSEYTAWLAAVCSVSDMLMKNNARFEAGRFLAAAGATDSTGEYRRLM